MQLPHTYYRRRFFDGRQHVFHSYGAGRVVCDTADVLVMDWSLGTAQRITDGVGWSIDAPRSRLFPANAVRAYGRSWWWRTRPMNVMNSYDSYGNLVIQRIDFASFALTMSNCVYQTDLYLDCFVAADGTTHLVEDEDDEAFNDKMERLTAQLAEQMAKGAELDAVIREKLGAIGHAI